MSAKVLWSVLPFKSMVGAGAVYYAGINAMKLLNYMAQYAKDIGWERVAQTVIYMNTKITESFGQLMALGKDALTTAWNDILTGFWGTGVPQSLVKGLTIGLAGQYFGQQVVDMMTQGVGLDAVDTHRKPLPVLVCSKQEVGR